jgi:glycosyltransferase involved in cell wall biosynthesis
MERRLMSRMLRVAFIVSEFPRPVDAYLLRELLALEARGLDLRIYSLRRPAHAATPRRAAALIARTVYAPALATRGMCAAHAAWLRRRPGAYAAALLASVRGHAASPRLLAKVLAVWPQAVFFARRAAEDGIEHLHANWATYPAAAAAAIGRLVGVPWSFAGHASDIHLDPTNLPAKIRAAKFVATCTEDARQYLLRLAPDVDGERIHTIHHGIEVRSPRPERSGGADLHLLAVGTLRDCKGFDTLLQAVARLAAAALPVRLTVVGDGEDRPGLERLAADLGIAARVTFTGYVPHEELARHYAAATMLVHPARSANHFGIPNVILEAQLARLPVVCTMLPAMAELMDDGRSGVYVPEDDAEHLSAELARLFADPERRRRLAEEGFRRVSERFDIERTIERWTDLFSTAGVSRPQEAVA